MEVLLVRAADEITYTLKRVVEDRADGGTADRSDISGDDARLLGNGTGMDLEAEIIAEFRLVDVEVASDVYDDITVVLVLLVDDRFAGALFVGTEEFADFLYRSLPGSGDFFKRLRRDALVLDPYLRRLHIGGVTALGADREGVLADLGEKHEFVGDGAAHHTRVALD